MDESELAKIPVILTREASQERYQIGSIEQSKAPLESGESQKIRQ
jgi:hypothetical protein